MAEPQAPVRHVSAIADDALGTSDAVDLIRRLRQREVSAPELHRASRERIRAADAALNAVVVEIGDDPGTDHDGPFAGIPIALKDNEDLRGYPTSWGSAAFGGRRAAGSSPIAAQLLSLGMRPLVKTTMPEFGLTATTEALRFGPTRNPWDTDRSTGGSSGGSAALVAAGAVPLAHANDGGGSIRIPASCCGLVGLKPSRGRIVDLPDRERAPVNLVTQGVVTRSVRDTALFFAAAEQRYRNPALPPIGHVERPVSRRLRVGLLATGYRGLEFSPVAAEAAQRAGALCESLGHRVEPVDHGYPETFGHDFLRYWALLAFGFKNLGRYAFGANFDGRRTEPFTDGMAGLLRLEAERVPASLLRLRRFAHSEQRLERRYDIVIAPVLGHEPPLIGWLGAEVPFRTHLVRLLRYAMSTPVQNVIGAPAISLPIARSPRGLPVGVQFSADVGRESLLLALALQLEEAAPWQVTPQP